MIDDEYWSAVRDMRLRIAGQLASLSPAEWDAPSLCPGWRVRDVAGHLSIVPTITTWQMLAVAPRARFNPHRINTLMAVRRGSARTDAIVSEIRAHAASRGTAKSLDARNALFDVIVHSQDIALPLGREFGIPVELSRAALDRVWAMGWPFHARRRLRGLTLRATDTDWTVGTGPEVTGAALSLLLLLTGRTTTAARALRGPGVAALTG
jgi:uncharacterized protein (TIGR03083 family)